MVGNGAGTAKLAAGLGGFGGEIEREGARQALAIKGGAGAKAAAAGKAVGAKGAAAAGKAVGAKGAAAAGKALVAGKAAAAGKGVGVASGAAWTAKGFGLGMGMGFWGPVILGVLGATAIYGYLRKRNGSYDQSETDLEIQDALG